MEEREHKIDEISPAGSSRSNVRNVSSKNGSNGAFTFQSITNVVSKLTKQLSFAKPRSVSLDDVVWEVDEKSIDAEDLALENKALELESSHMKEDSGLPNSGYYHLSRQQARIKQSQSQIGYINNDGHRVPYPLNTDFGWIEPPRGCDFHQTGKIINMEEQTPNREIDNNQTVPSTQKVSILDANGIGLSFYFKLLKALIIIFICMNLLTIPVLILYSSFNTTDSSDLAYNRNFAVLRQLSYTSIGALGHPIASCRDVEEGEMFRFSCPGEGRIQSIIAYYGQPEGACGCPGQQQASITGDCKGTISDYGVIPYVTFQGLNCVPDAHGNTLPCFLGLDRFNTYCCSLSKDSYGLADFSHLELQPNYGCNSFTAPFIARALCTGQRSCEFNVSSTVNYRFPVSSLAMNGTSRYDTSQICTSIDSSLVTSEPMCNTNLLYNGNFDTCSRSTPKKLLFEAVCVQNSKTIVDNKVVNHSTIVNVALYLNCVSILIFILGVLWIRNQLSLEDNKHSTSTCRASQYTVTCDAIPCHENFSSLRADYIHFFEKTLSHVTPVIQEETVRVADVNFSTSCYKYLQMACKRGELAKQIDGVIIQFCALIHHQRFNGRCWRDIFLLNLLKKNLYEFHVVNNQCQTLQHEASESINQAYITFETEEGYLRSLSYFQPHSPPPERLDGLPVSVKQSVEPSEINWENIGLPLWNRFLRVCITTFLILTLLGVSYFAIFEASYLASKVNIKYGNNQCGTYSISLNRDPNFMQTVDSNTITYQKTLWDHDWEHYNQSNYGSNGYIFCYCKYINLQQGRDAMVAYEFQNAVTGRSERWCGEYVEADNISSLATLFATFVIITINILLRQLLTCLVHFECMENSTHETISFALKIFLSQYINTGLLSLLIYGYLQRLGGKSIGVEGYKYFKLGAFAGSYYDFDAGWYAAVGTSLLLTMMLFTIGTQAKSLLLMLLQYMMRVFDKRTGRLINPRTKKLEMFREDVTHCYLQEDLEELYLGTEFPFEVQYGSLLTVLFMNMTYSAAMPLMNIISLESLLILYIMNKVLLLRFYRIPPVYSADLPRVITFLMLGAAFIHCCVGIWMFTNTDFYDPTFNDKDELVSSSNQAGATQTFLKSTHSWAGPINFNTRVSNDKGYLLLIIAVLLFGYFLFKLCVYMIVHVLNLNRLAMFFPSTWITRLFPSTSKRVFVPKKRDNPPYFDAIPVSTLQQRIKSNNSHAAILRRCQARLIELTSREGASKMPSKHLAGLESYDINNSPKYASKFAFHSEYLAMVKPKDWIIEKRTVEVKRRRSSVSSQAGASRRQGVTMALTGFVHFERNAHAEQVEALLAYCTPHMDTDTGNVTRKRYCFLHNDEFYTEIEGINRRDSNISSEFAEAGMSMLAQTKNIFRQAMSTPFSARNVNTTESSPDLEASDDHLEGKDVSQTMIDV